MRAAASTRDWLRGYYAALDHGRFDDVAELLHADCRSHYPTGGTDEGREAILRRMRDGLGRLAGIRHELLHVWEEGDEVIFELTVTYRRTDGREIARPGMGIFVRADGLIREQRLYVHDGGVWR